MASSRRGQQLRLGSYEPETPHFARTILPELLSLGKLEIPKAFIRKYGKDLLNSVLKIPTGETWTVYLEKNGDRVWLGRGWTNFMERYLILADYSIAFGFMGNSMFHTYICDQDGYQIDYPIRCSCRPRVNCTYEFPTPGNDAGRTSPVISIGDSRSSAEVHPESEPSDEVDSDFAAFLSATQATQRSGRGRRTRIHNEALAVTSPFTSHIGDSEPYDQDDPDYIFFLTATGSGCPRNRNPSEAFVAASMFTSYNPFFLVEVQAASLAKMTVTEGIMERCDLKSGLNAVTIEYLGRLSPVMVVCHDTHGTVCRGWKAFARNISLRRGDVCVLELVARKRFKVVVFKSKQ